MQSRQVFLQSIAQTSDSPLALEIEKGEGIYLFDTKGKKYIDLISGISVSSLGHQHPAITNAIKEQTDRHLHAMVYGEFVQAPQTKLADLLSKQLPSNLDNIYFVNSGSEATEGALKLAKRFTGRQEIIAFNKAYHGSTHGALSVMGDNAYKENFQPLLPNIKFLDFNKTAQLKQITKDTACVIIELIQGEAGVISANKDYLLALRKKCDETGTLLIFDEAQTGMGRTGTMFAFEQYEVIPDILLLAKAFGGGMPLGAFISSKEIMSSLMHNPVLGHITTFGGHPISCAAAYASLDTLLANNKLLINEVEEKAELFKQLLQHKNIKELRVAGLMIAIEFESADYCKKTIDCCLKKGIISDWFLFADNCLRIAPPLIITQQQIEESCGIILECISNYR